MSEPVFVCLGNPARTDDGVGTVVADRLRASHPDLAVRVSSGEPTDLIDLWAGVERVVVIDGVVTGSPPGTMHVLDASSHALPLADQTSSHGVGLAEAIELGRALGRLPDHLTVVGIEVGDTSPGTGLTPAVAAAVPVATAWILQELSRA